MDPIAEHRIRQLIAAHEKIKKLRTEVSSLRAERKVADFIASEVAELREQNATLLSMFNHFLEFADTCVEYTGSYNGMKREVTEVRLRLAELLRQPKDETET